MKINHPPFGMLMKGRTYSAQSSYRYGFNGKENDNEVKGEGDQQDYGMRIYDPRIGRWLSRDPLSSVTEYESPYCAMENNPINIIDPTGMIGEPATHTVQKGDTYSSISKKYGVSVDDLRKWNKYKDTKIPIGAKIILNDPNQKLPAAQLVKFIDNDADISRVKYLTEYEGSEFNKIVDHIDLAYDRNRSKPLSQTDQEAGKILSAWAKGSVNLDRSVAQTNFNRVTDFRINMTRVENTVLVATGIGQVAPLVFWGVAEGTPIAISLYEDAGFVIKYYGDRVITWVARDLFYAMRYSLRNVLNAEQLMKLEKMAEKYRDIQKFYKEVKKYKDLYDAIKKIMKNGM